MISRNAPVLIIKNACNGVDACSAIEPSDEVFTIGDASVGVTTLFILKFRLTVANTYITLRLSPFLSNQCNGFAACRGHTGGDISSTSCVGEVRQSWLTLC